MVCRYSAIYCRVTYFQYKILRIVKFILTRIFRECIIKDEQVVSSMTDDLKDKYRTMEIVCGKKLQGLVVGKLLQ